MTRSELVLSMARKNPHLSFDEAERIVNAVFEEISATLIKRGRVEIRGFGAFATRHRRGRAGRNPRTGETVQVAAKTVPYFRTGKLLNVRLNRKD